MHYAERGGIHPTKHRSATESLINIIIPSTDCHVTELSHFQIFLDGVVTINTFTSNTIIKYGRTSPAGVYSRVEVLQVSHGFKTIFAISSERKITMTRNIYHKLDNILGYY